MLCSSEEAPTWRREPGIEGHYRVCRTYGECLRGLFAVHNQTGNVWSHLIGLVGFPVLAYVAFTTLVHNELVHQLMFVLLFGGSLACMVFSVCFHLFSAHMNESVFRRWLALDYFGITCCIVGSFFAPTYLAFACFPAYRVVYLSIISALGAIGLVGPQFPFFNAPEFQTQRLCLFGGMTVFGLVPTFHVIVVLPFNGATTPFIGGIFLMLALYGAGLVFYLTKFPESVFPGRFDLLFHSHQLWHLFVLAAAVVHTFTCMGMYRHWAGDLQQMLSGAHC